MSTDRDPLKHYTTPGAEAAVAPNDGGSAYPWDERNDDGSYFCTHEGMTLRDYFAAKAMQGMLANPETCGAHTHSTRKERDECAYQRAEIAYALANAMLLARAGSTP